MNNKTTNSIKERFFEDVPESVLVADGDELSFGYADISDMMSEACVVLDFQKRNFLHLPYHDLFLCGYSMERVEELGYDFFQEALHPKDLALWIEMYKAILKCLYNNELPTEKINYFACTFRVKNYISQAIKPDYLMIYLKLKPKWINGELRYGICLLSGSIVPTSGNLSVYYYDHSYAEYSLKTQKWNHRRFLRLSKREKEVLVLYQQGLKQKEQADRMYVTEGTIENLKYNLFQKLGVNSMQQALQYAINRRMFFHTQPAKHNMVRTTSVRL